jgi:hypothetical protein
MPQPWQTTARGLGVLALYLFAFWKIFRTHQGNRVVRCGIIALVVFAALVVLIRLHSVPDWILSSVGLLLLLLCLLTMSFLFQQ